MFRRSKIIHSNEYKLRIYFTYTVNTRSFERSTNTCLLYKELTLQKFHVEKNKTLTNKFKLNRVLVQIIQDLVSSLVGEVTKCKHK